MNKKAIPFLLLILLAIAVIAIKKWESVENDPATEKTSTAKNVTRNKSRGFDRTLSFLEYTKHALCRMQCRQISKSDIEDIMRSGKINYAKTDVNDKPCPTYALQGITNDGQNIRVIFAQCSEKTKVVTCYDLEKDFECYCPGDEKKKKN